VCCARRSRAHPRRGLRRSRPSGSRTSARRSWSGTATRWSRSTGPSSGRTAARPAICRELEAAGHEREVRRRTGLLLDPYFSGTKLVWLFRERPDLRARAEAGDLACGTIDTWLDGAHDRWARARHRPHQRFPHAAVRPAPARLVAVVARPARGAGRAAARGAAQQRRLRGGAGRLAAVSRPPSSGWPVISRRRSSGRAAGTRVWPRTPMAPAPFCSCTRGVRRSSRSADCSPPRRWTSRRGPCVRAGGLDLHRRRGHPVAARRPRHPGRGAGVGGPGRLGRRKRRRLLRAGVRGTRRAPLGARGAWHAGRADAGHGARARGPGRPRGHGVRHGRRPPRHGGGFGGGRERAPGRWRRHGERLADGGSRPASSEFRSVARPCSRPPPSGRRAWRGWPRECGRTGPTSWRPWASRRGSSRPWRPTSVTDCSTAGAAPCMPRPRGPRVLLEAVGGAGILPTPPWELPTLRGLPCRREVVGTAPGSSALPHVRRSITSTGDDR
jgi:hypothetical protein